MPREKRRNTCNTQTRLREGEIRPEPRLRDLLSDFVPRSPLAKNLKATHKDRRDGRFRREMMFTQFGGVEKTPGENGYFRAPESAASAHYRAVEKCRLRKVRLQDPLTEVSPYESSRQSLVSLAVPGDSFWSGSRSGLFTVPLCTLEHVWGCRRC
jgi:hypothetical protein